MGSFEQEIKRYESKMRSCATMTELLVAMSSWQSFAEAYSVVVPGLSMCQHKNTIKTAIQNQ